AAPLPFAAWASVALGRASATAVPAVTPRKSRRVVLGMARRLSQPLPRDAVVLAVVARPAPGRSVLAVEVDRIDGAGGEPLVVELVAHARELLAHPWRHRLGEREPAGLRNVVAERVAHLVARDVRRLARLLHVHAELHDVEEELQQVLVLCVAPL